jgi:hypothetical protein
VARALCQAENALAIALAAPIELLAVLVAVIAAMLHSEAL